MLRVFIVLTAFLAASCGRNLTSGEIAFLAEFHGNNVDYSAIQIRKSALPGVFTKEGAMANGNELLWNKNTYKEDFTKDYDGSPVILNDLKLLAHEVTHVWQYSSGVTPNCQQDDLIREHIEHGDDVYKYKENGRLNPNRAFLSYRCEQQGAIVADWVHEFRMGSVQAIVYERVVRQAIPDIREQLLKRTVLN